MGWRRVRLILACLLIGAIANVFVALCCARWVSTTYDSTAVLDAADPRAEGNADRVIDVYRGFGVRIVDVWPVNRIRALHEIDALFPGLRVRGGDASNDVAMAAWAWSHADAIRGTPAPLWYDIRMYLAGQHGVMSHVDAGWPIRSFTCAVPTVQLSQQPTAGKIEFIDGAAIIRTDRTQPAIIPLRPTRGFAVNAVVYALLTWCVIAGPCTMIRAVRRSRGACPTCGYPSGESEACTECGTALRAKVLGCHPSTG